mmetsp:Transcript_65228/g.121591  ORF Transcript_65228/g.121591 Transcript_65228/m.121591 type:complete len:218 (+) Transcript_65228:1634-2287(+)
MISTLPELLQYPPWYHELWWRCASFDVESVKLQLQHICNSVIELPTLLAEGLRAEVFGSNLLEIRELPTMSLSFPFHRGTCSFAYCCPHSDQSGFLSLGLCLLHNLLKDAGVVHITICYVEHIPALCSEDGGHIFAEGEIRATIDGDLVVIVEDDQFVQLQVARQGCGLGDDALHHAAIPCQDINIMIKDWEIWFIESRCQMSLADGHAHSIGEALA